MFETDIGIFIVSSMTVPLSQRKNLDFQKILRRYNFLYIDNSIKNGCSAQDLTATETCNSTGPYLVLHKSILSSTGPF